MLVFIVIYLRPLEPPLLDGAKPPPLLLEREGVLNELLDEPPVYPELLLL